MANISPLTGNINVDTSETIKASGGFVEKVCRMFSLGKYSSKNRIAKVQTDLEVAKLEVEKERALVDRAKVRAEGMADVAKMLQGAGVDPDSLAGRAIQSEVKQAERKQVNRENVWELTEPMLTDEARSGRTEKDIDEDKIFDIFERFSKVSHKELQLMWAKILAGELNQTTSFLGQTLDIASKMSKEDAEFFQRVCSFVVVMNDEHSVLITAADSPIYTDAGLNHKVLWALEDLGLVRFVALGGRALTFRSDGHLPIVQGGNRCVLLKIEEGFRQVPLGKVYFTKAGEQLCKVVEAEPHPDLLHHLLSYYEGHFQESKVFPWPVKSSAGLPVTEK